MIPSEIFTPVTSEKLTAFKEDVGGALYALTSSTISGTFLAQTGEDIQIIIMGSELDRMLQTSTLVMTTLQKGTHPIEAMLADLVGISSGLLKNKTGAIVDKAKLIELIAAQ